MKSLSLSTVVLSTAISASGLTGCAERVGQEIYIKGNTTTSLNAETGAIEETSSPEAAKINEMLLTARKEFEACWGRDATACHQNAITKRDRALSLAGIPPKTETWYVVNDDNGISTLSNVNTDTCRSIPGCTTVDARK